MTPIPSLRSGIPPLRYGILGAARIARQFAEGLAGSEAAGIVAVASRDQAKAGAFAAEYGIPRTHGSYQALLEDRQVEAVYIPLPNDMHAAWAIRAAEAGKHVLCEKPLCLGVEEARAMFAAAHAHRVLLAEAYPYMAQPQTLKLRALLAEGVVGRVQVLTVAVGFGLCTPEGISLANPGDIRLQPVRGGGALLDAGTYSASLARIVVGERPKRVLAAWRLTPSGVDLTFAAMLEFPSGAIAQITGSMATAFHRYAVIAGEKGALETNYNNDAPPDGRMELKVKRGVPRPVPLETVTVEGGSGFRAEAESFAHAVRLGPEHWTGASEAESIDVVLTLQAIAAAAKSGSWATVGS